MGKREMAVIKLNWDIFKAKFSENPQENFEWFCYLLFCKEYNQPYGIHRYKNQSGIETDTIKVNNEVIGWQSKFYEGTLSNRKEELIETLEKTKKYYHNITKIILYTNSEWGEGRFDKKSNEKKQPIAKTKIEEKAKELDIKLVLRTKSYFDSPFVCQEQIDISRYFFELKYKWELTNLGFQDKLINNYQTNFKTISLLLNDEKPIDDIFINLAIIKEQKEKDKKDKTYKREAILNSYEEIHKPKEPIEIKELLNISKKSLIYGKAGIGKTTLCKYIAYKWAKNELYNEFEYIVYIALREWKRDGLKGAILDNYYSSDIKELYFDIEENSSKILFLFDGYDELDADRKITLQKEINAYKLQNYIITTRPYGYQKSDFNVDESFETIGFTDENVEAYIENFFEESQKEKSLKEFLQNNINIKYIAYIPLMLEMICSLWEDEEFQESVTMTELYGQVVENILKKHSASKNDESVYKRQNRKKITEQLGALAFKGLTQQKIVFDGDFIEETLNNSDIDFFEQNTINSGFLKSDNIDKDLLDNNFEFLHLTFQEYFSALYVSKLSKKKQKKIIKKWKFYPHMQVFFAFLGGLIDDKEFLLGEIESEPRDLVGFYRTSLIFYILSQIKSKKIDELLTKNINKKIIEILDNKDLINNYFILSDINNVSYFVNKDMKDYLLSMIKNKNIDIDTKKQALQIVKYCWQDNILNDLIDLLDNKNIHNDIIDLLPSFNINKYNSIIEILIERLIKSNNIDDDSKEHIAFSFRKFNTINTKLLIDFIKKNDSNIVEYQSSTAYSLIKIYKDNQNEIYPLIVDILQDKSIDNKIKESILEALYSIKYSSKELIKFLIAIVKDKSYNDVIKGFASLNLIASNYDNKLKNIELFNNLGREDSSIINRLNSQTIFDKKDIEELFKVIVFYPYGSGYRHPDYRIELELKKIRVKSKYIVEIFIKIIKSKINNNYKVFLISKFLEITNPPSQSYPQDEIFNEDIIKKNLFECFSQDKELFKILIEIVENQEYEEKERIHIIIFMLNMGYSNYKYICNLIKDSSLKIDFKIELFYELINLDSYEYIDSYIESNISKNFIKVAQKDSKLIEVLSNFIENRDIENNLKDRIILFLILVPKKDYSFNIEKIIINFYKQNMKNLSEVSFIDEYRKQIVQSFLNFNKVEDMNKYLLDFINTYMYNDENMHNIYLLCLIDKDLENFKKIDKDKYNIESFLSNISTEILFNAYNKGYIDIDICFFHILINKLPLYLLKEKSVCTIYNGQEIILKVDIDSSPLIKEMLIKVKPPKKNKITKNSFNVPRIITEGKTDWKHLKKALEKFQKKGEYLDLNIEFDEYENRGSGEAYLRKQLDSFSSQSNEKRMIGIFDRDTPKYIKEYGEKIFVKIIDKDYKNRLKERVEKIYSDKSSPKYINFEKNLEDGKYDEIDKELNKILTGNDFEEWKKLSRNNVYAFCIPEIKNSDSPRTLNDICIEFYYKEKDLKTVTKNGKRLFFADEFKFNKDNTKNDNSKRFISSCGNYKTVSNKVKEGAREELTLVSSPVFKIDDEKCEKNILLSKNDFTNNIINEVEGFNDFDIGNFRLIFGVIKKIVND